MACVRRGMESIQLRKKRINSRVYRESLPSSTVAKCQRWKWIVYAVEGDIEGGGVGEVGLKGQRKTEIVTCVSEQYFYRSVLKEWAEDRPK